VLRECPEGASSYLWGVRRTAVRARPMLTSPTMRRQTSGGAPAHTLTASASNISPHQARAAATSSAVTCDFARFHEQVRVSDLSIRHRGNSCSPRTSTADTTSVRSAFRLGDDKDGGDSCHSSDMELEDTLARSAMNSGSRRLTFPPLDSEDPRLVRRSRDDRDVELEETLRARRNIMASVPPRPRTMDSADPRLVRKSLDVLQLPSHEKEFFEVPGRTPSYNDYGASRGGRTSPEEAYTSYHDLYRGGLAPPSAPYVARSSFSDLFTAPSSVGPSSVRRADHHENENLFGSPPSRPRQHRHSWSPASPENHALRAHLAHASTKPDSIFQPASPSAATAGVKTRFADDAAQQAASTATSTASPSPAPTDEDAALPRPPTPMLAGLGSSKGGRRRASQVKANEIRVQAACNNLASPPPKRRERKMSNTFSDPELNRRSQDFNENDSFDTHVERSSHSGSGSPNSYSDLHRRGMGNWGTSSLFGRHCDLEPPLFSGSSRTLPADRRTSIDTWPERPAGGCLSTRTQSTDLGELMRCNEWSAAQGEEPVGFAPPRFVSEGRATSWQPISNASFIAVDVLSPYNDCASHNPL